MVSLNIELVQALMQDREREAARRRQLVMARRQRRARQRRFRLSWFPGRRRYRPAIAPPASVCGN